MRLQHREASDNLVTTCCIIQRVAYLAAVSTTPPTFLTLFMNKGRLGWRPVTSGTSLLHSAGGHSATPQLKTVSPAQIIIWLTALVNKVENYLHRFVTMKWSWATVMRYILMLFVSPELHACTRRKKQCCMKLKTSGLELVSRIKFGIVFGIIFFIFYFFSINHRTETTEYDATYCLCAQSIIGSQRMTALCKAAAHTHAWHFTENIFGQFE